MHIYCWAVSLTACCAQVMLAEGPTTYSLGDLRDATKLAQKIVQSYGMTNMGITMHAPKQHAIGFMKRAFEVRVKNLHRSRAQDKAEGRTG